MAASSSVRYFFLKSSHIEYPFDVSSCYDDDDDNVWKFCNSFSQMYSLRDPVAQQLHSVALVFPEQGLPESLVGIAETT